MKFLPALFAGLILSSQSLVPIQAQAAISQPVVSDSRVKTFVYNENEVYTILTQHGYQTNIEFGRGEEIQTISVGDRIAWQIIPAGRRLFIQTLQDNTQTNLTVVTSLRAYQFDLKSTVHTKGIEDQIVYVARFYYPDEDWDAPLPVQAPDSLLKPAVEDSFNFHYTYAGPDHFAPVKIFDDGASTYFQFAGTGTPHIARVNEAGHEVPLQVRQQNGYVVVTGTAGQFALRQGQEVICVFNERLRGR